MMFPQRAVKRSPLLRRKRHPRARISDPPFSGPPRRLGGFLFFHCTRAMLGAELF